MKRFKPLRKYDGNELYIFVGCVAKVPGMFYQGSQMTVTLKEFNKLRGKK